MSEEHPTDSELEMALRVARMEVSMLRRELIYANMQIARLSEGSDAVEREPSSRFEQHSRINLEHVLERIMVIASNALVPSGPPLGREASVVSRPGAGVLQLEAELDPPRIPLLVGWRGLLDFGELWTEADAELWPGPGDLPVGSPLVYGCEVLALSADVPIRAKLMTWAVESRREVMSPGAAFTLNDGNTPRVSGTLV